MTKFTSRVGNIRQGQEKLKQTKKVMLQLDADIDKTSYRNSIRKLIHCDEVFCRFACKDENSKHTHPLACHLDGGHKDGIPITA